MNHFYSGYQLKMNLKFTTFNMTQGTPKLKSIFEPRTHQSEHKSELGSGGVRLVKG